MASLKVSQQPPSPWACAVSTIFCAAALPSLTSFLDICNKCISQDPFNVIKFDIFKISDEDGLQKETNIYDLNEEYKNRDKNRDKNENLDWHYNRTKTGYRNKNDVNKFEWFD